MTSRSKQKTRQKRLMRCVQCSSERTSFSFFYRFRWYRTLRRAAKIRCAQCGCAWTTPYP